MGNVLNDLPERLQPSAKGLLREIMYSETLSAAVTEQNKFAHEFHAKYPKAVEKLEKDSTELTAFFVSTRSNFHRDRSSWLKFKKMKDTIVLGHGPSTIICLWTSVFFFGYHRWMKQVNTLRMISMACVVVGLFSQVDAAAEDKYSGAWQGEWAWGDNEPSGTISIYDCVQESCIFILQSGSSQGVCDLSGKILLKSETSAVYTPDKTDSTCRFKLTQKRQTLDIEEDTKGCREFCGPAGDFGSGYTRYSRIRYYIPSFECRKAKSKIEISICGDEKLSNLDRDLSNAFQVAKTHAKDKSLVSEQKRWVLKRNQTCLSDMNLKKCLEISYEERIKDLNKNKPSK